MSNVLERACCARLHALVQVGLGEVVTLDGSQGKRKWKAKQKFCCGLWCLLLAQICGSDGCSRNYSWGLLAAFFPPPTSMVSSPRTVRQIGVPGPSAPFLDQTRKFRSLPTLEVLDQQGCNSRPFVETAALLETGFLVLDSRNKK